MEVPAPPWGIPRSPSWFSFSKLPPEGDSYLVVKVREKVDQKMSLPSLSSLSQAGKGPGASKLCSPSSHRLEEFLETPYPQVGPSNPCNHSRDPGPLEQRPAQSARQTAQ